MLVIENANDRKFSDFILFVIDWKYGLGVFGVFNWLGVSFV